MNVREDFELPLETHEQPVAFNQLSDTITIRRASEELSTSQEEEYLDKSTEQTFEQPESMSSSTQSKGYTPPTIPEDQKRIIVVFGGTGQQGRGVIKALRKDGRFIIRTLSRTPESKKALKLTKKGIQVYGGNMWKEQDVQRVLQGAYGVFLILSYADPQLGCSEDVGRLIVDVAKEAGVQHFVFSTAPNIEKMTLNKYSLPKFSNFTKLNQYIKLKNFQTFTFLRPAFFYQNFATILAPRLDNGVLNYIIPMPEDKFLTAVDARDVGPVAAIVFSNPELYHGRKINIAGDHLHPQDYIIKLGILTKTPVKVSLVKPREYENLGLASDSELVNWFRHMNKNSYFGDKEWAQGKRIYPHMRTWEEYLKRELRSVEGAM